MGRLSEIQTPEEIAKSKDAAKVAKYQKRLAAMTDEELAYEARVRNRDLRVALKALRSRRHLKVDIQILALEPHFTITKTI